MRGPTVSRGAPGDRRVAGRLLFFARGSAAPWAIALLASGIVGAFAIRSILERAGRPAVPLDDVFIHFQFARRIAEGAPLRYTGDEASSGATSFAWPLILAPLWKLGARGLSLVWVTWILGTIAHAGVAVDTARLAKRFTDRGGAIAAGAMCLAFGPFAWFAWSGMETMALAWVLVRSARVAGEALDGDRAFDRRLLVELGALGFAAPLVRPEGALASLFVAVAIARRARGRARLAIAAPILGVILPPLVFWAATGDPTSSTARVKWLVYSPYFGLDRLAAQIGYHAKLLLFDVWDGGEWTWVFVPKGLVLGFLFGAATMLRAGRRAPWSAVITIALLCGAFATCSYQTFLWNRMRYVWPFVPAGFVLCATLAHEIGDLLRRWRAPLQMASPLLGGVIAARLAALLPDAFEDLATSASAVDRQQVKLGEWARASLPKDALVGVNDTGAIAYLGERRTFDIVGLTTPGVGPAWVAGAGSRFELMEGLPRASLPGYFVVYPEWFGCDALLGRELTRAVVVDHAILGGDAMVAYEADLSLLGSGALPFEPIPGARLVDEIDVADLASEAAHRYPLFDAWDTDDITRDVTPKLPGARRMIDGGRDARAFDVLRFAPPKEATDLTLVMRVGAEEPVRLRVTASGGEPVTLSIPASSWYEVAVPVFRDSLPWDDLIVHVVALGEDGAPVPVWSRSRGPRFAAFHYWLYAR